MSRRIKGITIEVDGDTTGLDKALSGVNKSTRDIQKELRDVDRLLKFNPKNVELLTQKKKLLAQQVDNTKQKLEGLKQAQEQVNQQFKNGEISESQYRNFQREIVETESKLKHYENTLKQVDNTQRSFGESIQHAGGKVKDFGDGMTSVGKDLTMKVTAPLMAFGTVAAKAGVDFEAGMSEVQAISGATASEVEELESKARELGASTKFSATEVAEGFKYMALAGWDVQQSIDAIPGVLDLAAASGEDLAIVSDILTDAISAFGDKASDAERYADVLAAAATNANTDVAGLGEAFKYVAPVAGALNYEVEDVAVALGLMANQGIKGSSAGTALRNVLTNLTSPTKEMATEMEKYGISIKDSNGEIKPLDQLLTELRGTFADLSEDQKAQLAATLAGKEGMSGLLAIVNASDEEFNALTDAIHNSEGAAAKMAEVMGDTTKGRIDAMNSAIEGLAIQIFKALQPALDWVVKKITAVAEFLTNLNPKVLQVITIIGMVVAAIGPLLMIFGKLTSVVGSFMMTFGKIIPMFMGINPIVVAVVAVIGVLALAITKLWKESETFREVTTNVWNTIKEVISTVLEFLIGFITDIVGQIKEFWKENGEQIKEATENVWNAIKDFIEAVLPIIKTIIEVAFTVIKAVIEGVWTSIQNIIQGALDIILGIVKVFSSMFTGDWKGVWEGIKQITSGLAKVIWEFIQISFFGKLLKGVKAFVKPFANFFKTMWTSIKNTTSTITNAIKTVISKVWNSIKTTIEKVMNGIKTVITKVWDTIKGAVTTVVNAIKTVITTVWNSIKTTITNVMNGIKTTTSNVWNGIKTTISNVVNTIKTTVSNVWNSIKTTTTNTWNNVKTAMTKPINAAKDTIKKAIDAIKGFFSNLKLKIPDIKPPKLPKFTIKGKFGVNPPSVPKFGISWNAAGGIFKNPTIFNTANAGLQGVGEAGAEAIIPLKPKVLAGIGQGIADQMNLNNSGNGEVQVEIAPAPIYLDGTMIAEVTFETTNKKFGEKMNLDGYLRGV